MSGQELRRLQPQQGRRRAVTQSTAWACQLHYGRKLCMTAGPCVLGMLMLSSISMQP